MVDKMNINPISWLFSLFRLKDSILLLIIGVLLFDFKYLFLPSFFTETIKIILIGLSAIGIALKKS